MKSALLTAIGPAEAVVRCVEVPDLGDPGSGEVLVDVHACSINPADILLIEGRYATRPSPPCGLGIEGAGTVVAIGPDVTTLAVGDKVMSLGRTNWTQRIRDHAHALVRLPAEVDLSQAAMLKVNVATAHLMLRNYVTLAEGDWVIQNAANSGVGVDLIRLARTRNLRSVNVVRREALVSPLLQLGADVVVVDGPDLARRVNDATGGAPIRLGIDAIAGDAIGRLATCVSEGGTVVNYGLLSGQPCRIDPFDLVFRDVKFAGFWLAPLMKAMTMAEIQTMYDGLATLLLDGTIRVAVEASYGLDHISDALAHAKREARGGKIQIRPND